MTGTRLEVDAHIVSATSTVLHNLLKSVQQLGLKVDDVVFSGWASSSAVLTDTEKELGVMLLDIGGVIQQYRLLLKTQSLSAVVSLLGA